jgi:hypothetical protein
VSSSSTRRNKQVIDEEQKTDDAEDGRKLQASLSRAQAALDKVAEHQKSSPKSDQEEPSTLPPKAAEATKSNLEKQGEEMTSEEKVETEGNMPTPEKTAPEKPKSDTDPTGSQKGSPPQKMTMKRNKPRQEQIRKRKRRKT